MPWQCGQRMPPSRRLDSARCRLGTTITDKDSVHGGHDAYHTPAWAGASWCGTASAAAPDPEPGADNAGKPQCADAIRIDAPAREAARVARHGDGADQDPLQSRCISIETTNATPRPSSTSTTGHSTINDRTRAAGRAQP